MRIDVDGTRPMNVISGDFYSNSQGKRKYLNSFRFEDVKKAKTAADIIFITGKSGKFDPDSNRFADIQVSIQLNSYPLKATIQWINSLDTPSKCLCKKESSFFRKVYLEHHYEEGVVPFISYNTNELFSPSPHRLDPISISNAYAEAGIEMTVMKENFDSIPHPKGIPGMGSIWTDSELYEAMRKHFRKVKDPSQATIWLFSAYEYVIVTTKGTRLTHNGKNRPGCAVFRIATGWQSPEEKRMLLFIYIHEIGHCFNLRHPWENTQSNSLDCYSTLSWMNYPWRYYLSEKSRGSEAFWKRFRFQFADSELIHLRHGFRNDVIFGGKSFSEEP